MHETGPNFESLRAAQDAALEAYCIFLTRRRYSLGTVRNYSNALRQFLAHIAPKAPEELDHMQVCAALARLAEDRGIGASRHNLINNAVRLYYEAVEGRPRLACGPPRQSTSPTLPKVLTRAEVQAIFKATLHLKHKCLLVLIYGTGMRLSELLALRRQDWDARKGVLLVRKLPGKKAREIPLPESLLRLLTMYLQTYNPRVLLFEGRAEGTPLGERTLQIILHRIAERAGISRAVTPNMLRHSYATHVLEGGGSLHYLQEMMGHSSLRTTSVYTYTARMRRPSSPAEGLEF